MKTDKKLKGRDLINIGIYAAIYSSWSKGKALIFLKTMPVSASGIFLRSE